MRLPIQNGRWSVRHGKDLFADIVQTKNLSFDEGGFIKLARKPIALYSNADDGDFDKCVAIVPNDASGVYYLVTIDGVFSLDPSPFAVTQLTATNQPTTYGGSDAIFFNGALHVSGTTTVTDWTGSAWTSAARITGLSADYPHPMAVFEDRIELSIGNGNTVKNYSTGYSNGGSTSPFTLTIPAQYIVTSLRWRAGRMYVGTRHQYGGEAKLFVWDGGATSAPNGYGVGANWIYSMAEYGGSIVVLTSRGQLLRFNGGGFDELARLPVYDTPYSWESSASVATSSFGNCPNRGMAAIGTKLYLNITGDLRLNSNDYPGNYLHTQPSGLWVYDPGVGLYHRSGHQQPQFRTLTVTTLTSNVLGFGGVGHYLKTGDPVLAQSVSNITGLTQFQMYSCIKESETSLKLALSRADALNGDEITLSGTPSGDTLRVDSIAAYGATFDTIAGAICPFASTFQRPFYGTELLFACEPINTANTTTHILNSLGDQANRGYFVTSPIPPSALTDTFQKLFLWIQDMLYDADEIIIKYRLKKRAGLPTPARTSDTGLATWTSPTTFTIDTTVKDAKSAAIGDEVEFISGAVAGYSSKITAIDTTSSTYAYTIEDSLPTTAGDLSEAVFENWTVLNIFDTTDPNLAQGYLQALLGDGNKSSMIQFKVEVRGYGGKIRALDAVSKAHKYPV